MQSNKTFYRYKIRGGGGICDRESEKGTTSKNYFYLNFQSDLRINFSNHI